MNSKNLVRLAAVTTLTAGLALTANIPAQAGNGGVAKSGSCLSASTLPNSTWSLKASPDDGQIEVEAEVDSNVVGQIWTYQISKTTPAVTSGPTSTTNGHTRTVAKGL